MRIGKKSVWSGGGKRDTRDVRASWSRREGAGDEDEEELEEDEE